MNDDYQLIVLTKTIESQQRDYCAKLSHDCFPASLDSKLGFALQTQGQVPINGLRHPPEGDTSGWYLWCGETLSQEPDFFSAIHVSHVSEICPEVIKFLGLPPGYRFLVAGDYEDVWYDPELLVI